MAINSNTEISWEFAQVEYNCDIYVYNINPQEVYSTNILTKPKYTASISALFAECGWNNDFIYSVKP